MTDNKSQKNLKPQMTSKSQIANHKQSSSLASPIAYSVLNAFTGFDNAAFNACALTVTKAIVMAAIAAIT